MSRAIRKIRFSLRKMLLGVAGLAAVLGAWNFWERAASRQERAVQEVERATGGTVVYTRRAPKWLVKWLGVHYFERPASLYFFERGNYELAALELLPTIEAVESFDGPLGPAAIPTLKRMPNLRSLHAIHSWWSNDDIARLTELNHLEELAVATSGGGGPAEFDDEGVRSMNFATWTNLRRLSLGSGRITAAVIEEIRKAPHLETLQLGMAGQIADDSVPRLATLSGLKQLDVRNTSISPDGVARLKEALPQCYIGEVRLGVWWE